MWIEWNEAARVEQLARILPQCTAANDRELLRGGILLAAHPSGRAASLRTFWLRGAARPEALLGAVETQLNLDGGMATAPPAALFEGGAVRVCDPEDAHLDELLACARFRLDPAWLHYYGATARSAGTRGPLLQRSLTVALDVPVLLALLLLMSLRPCLPRTAVRQTRLNAKRARRGKHALLEHLEVSCPVFAMTAPALARQRFRRSAQIRVAPASRARASRAALLPGLLAPHWRGHARRGACAQPHR